MTPYGSTPKNKRTAICRILIWLTMNLSVIVVNWFSRDALRRCVGSLLQHCRGIQLEVIVVDNGSFDGSRDLLLREFSSVIYVQSEANLGLAGGNNLGAKHATGDHLLFMHSDVELVENSLSALLEKMKFLKDAGAVGCQLLNPDRTNQTGSVRAFPTIINQVLDSEYLRERFPDSKLWGDRMVHAAWSRHTEVDAVSAACILVRRNCFEQIGGFNEKLFVAGAEVDLCFRLRAVGRLVYFVPETHVIHHGGSTHPSRVLTVGYRQATYQFISRNRGPLTAMTYRGAIALSALLRLIFIPPLMPLGKTFVRHGKASWLKWYSVLKWSLGLLESEPTRPSGSTAAAP